MLFRFISRKRRAVKADVEPEQIPNWLKELQENSWEAELLVSGGAVFSLFQLSDLFTQFFSQISVVGRIPGQAVLLIVGMVAIKGITLGFIFHLIIRSLWVALVSLSSVFGDGMDPSRVKLAAPFELSDRNSLNRLIMQLDKVAGLAIFYAILFVFIVLGFMIHISTLLFLAIGAMGEGNYPFVEAIFVYSFLAYWFDLFFFGVLRKIPYLSYVSYPVFKLYDLLSFRWLYGSSLELISSRINRWKTFSYMTVFLSLTIIFSYITLYRIMHWPFLFDRRENIWSLAPESPFSDHYYLDNYAEGDFPTLLTIPSEVIEGGYLELHVIYRKEYDGFMEKMPAEKRLLSELFEVSIDDSIIDPVDWQAWYPDRRDQFGLKAYIDIDSLPRGKHMLQIRNKYWEDDGHGYPEKAIVPFWRD